MCGIGEKGKHSCHLCTIESTANPLRPYLADRRPIDPAPIVQLRAITHDQPVRDALRIDTASAPPPVERKPGQGTVAPVTPGVRGGVPVTTTLGDGWEDKAWYLENPYLFMYAMLCHADTDEELHLLNDGKTRYTSGSCVSCLYHLKDIDGSHQGFFVFPDLSIRVEGRYRLKLCLFEIIGQSVHHCKSVYSEPFHVYTAKRFPGMEESTRLSRSFAEQGLKVRVRKHPRSRRRESKRPKPDSDASESEPAHSHDLATQPAKKSRASDASGSGPRASARQSTGNNPLDERSAYSRAPYSPEQSRLAPSRRHDGSSSWDADLTRGARSLAARDVDYDYPSLHRTARVDRDPGPPEALYRDTYALRDRDIYQRPKQWIDPISARQEQGREVVPRMPPPSSVAVTRHGELPPLAYNQPYPGYGRPSTDRTYARPYPPPDYMTYEERRAFEDHHARLRMDAGVAYENRGIPRYARTPSPDARASHTAAIAENWSARSDYETLESRRVPDAVGPHEHIYAPRRSPSRPQLLYPPTARGAERQAYESDMYAGPSLATIRRQSDPYRRLPEPAPERSLNSLARPGRMAPDEARMAPVLPPMSTSPHTFRRETLSGMPMMSPRDAMEPVSRPYPTGYPGHSDAADVSKSARYGDRDVDQQQQQHRKTFRGPPPPSRPT